MIQRYEPGDRLAWRHDLNRYEVVPQRGARVEWRSTRGTVQSHTSQWIGQARRWFCNVLVEGTGKTVLLPPSYLVRTASP